MLEIITIIFLIIIAALACLASDGITITSYNQREFLHRLNLLISSSEEAGQDQFNPHQNSIHKTNLKRPHQDTASDPPKRKGEL